MTPDLQTQRGEVSCSVTKQVISSSHAAWRYGAVGGRNQHWKSSMSTKHLCHCLALATELCFTHLYPSYLVWTENMHWDWQGEGIRAEILDPEEKWGKPRLLGVGGGIMGLNTFYMCVEQVIAERNDGCWLRASQALFHHPGAHLVGTEAKVELGPGAQELGQGQP